MIPWLFYHSTYFWWREFWSVTSQSGSRIPLCVLFLQTMTNYLYFQGQMSFCPEQKMKFSLKDFLNKCELLRICSHILAKSLMGNVIFSVVFGTQFLTVWSSLYWFIYNIQAWLPFKEPVYSAMLYFKIIFWIWNIKHQSRLKVL